MKAVRIHEYGGPDRLIFEDGVPEPEISSQWVLVKAAATSVNPIDWKIRSGARQKDFALKLPAILGRDISGIVQAVGSEVRDFRVGDRVMATCDGTYAEYVAVDAHTLTHIPDGIGFEDAAALPLVSLTGDQLVRLAARLVAGQTIIVTGALGSVGRAAVHSAKKLGAHVIAGVREKDLDAAAALNADGLVAIDDDAAIASLEPVDAVADTVGGDTAMQLLAKVKSGGSFGYASVLAQSASASYPAVTITRVFAKPDPSKVREFADDVRDRKFVLPIGRRMPLKDAAAAHRLGEQGGVGKILLII